MLKNKYNFVSSFSKLLSVQFYHNFYKDNLLKEIEVFADEDTSRFLKSHGILMRFIENGFVLISKNDPKFESQNFAGEINLAFFLKIKSNFFLNITDIPYSNSQKFIFQNTQDVSNEKLHLNEFVDQKNTQSTDKDGIFGEIYLNINSKNQFFGSVVAREISNELVYSIHFNARKVIFRYNFFSTDSVIDFKKYFITDEQDSFKLNNFDTRVLANGMSVYFILIEEETLASQAYTKKLYLKKDDDFLTYFSIFLPYPKPNTINYDSMKNVYFNDVFVKI
jgi:hypothetical protein